MSVYQNYISVWNSEIKYIMILIYTEYMLVYFYSWFSVLIERAHTCTTSEHIRSASALFLSVPYQPACTLLACMHPAGALNLKAVLLLQQQDTLGQEQISLLLCLQLTGSPKAASSSAAAEPLAALAAPASCSELDSNVVWATNLHLNVVARVRAPGVDLLYTPPWECLDRQVQQLFCYGRECPVIMMTLKSLHKLKQLYFSHSAFKRSTIDEEHQNWSCVAGQK